MSKQERCVPIQSFRQLQIVQTAALIQFTWQCQSQGIDPATHIYQRAQDMGFKAASTRPPRREPPTRLSTLSGTARAPDKKGNITASDFSEMSEAEFDRFWHQMKGGLQGPAF